MYLDVPKTNKNLFNVKCMCFKYIFLLAANKPLLNQQIETSNLILPNQVSKTQLLIGPYCENIGKATNRVSVLHWSAEGAELESSSECLKRKAHTTTSQAHSRDRRAELRSKWTELIAS